MVELNYIAYVLSTKEMFLKLSKDEIINLIYKKDDGEVDAMSIDLFLKTILYLLDRDKVFIYLGKDLLNKIYDVVSEGRHLINNYDEEFRQDVFDKTNQIIIKLNNINTNDYEKKRKRYLQREIFIRTGEDDLDYEYLSIDHIEESVKEYICWDKVIFDALFSADKDFDINKNNLSILISSISYFCVKFSCILENKDVLRMFIYIKYVLESLIKSSYKKNDIDLERYICQKYVLGIIEKRLKEYIEKSSITIDDITKIKMKVKTSIV